MINISTYRIIIIYTLYKCIAISLIIYTILQFFNEMNFSFMFFRWLFSEVLFFAKTFSIGTKNWGTYTINYNKTINFWNKYICRYKQMSCNKNFTFLILFRKCSYIFVLFKWMYLFLYIYRRNSTRNCTVSQCRN